MAGKQARLFKFTLPSLGTGQHQQTALSRIVGGRLQGQCSTSDQRSDTDPHGDNNYNWKHVRLFGLVTISFDPAWTYASMIRRWRNALAGKRTPADSRRCMKLGRTPVHSKCP